MERLRFAYELKKSRVKARLEEFDYFYKNPACWIYDKGEIYLVGSGKPFNSRIFEELCFCLLTANTSAVIAMKAVDAIREIMDTATLEELQQKLKEAGYRYPNKRAEYIIEARENNFDFKSIIGTGKNAIELREFFVSNVKGIGYKEASHFLRNIGVFGLAILDKHILRTMHEYGYIKHIPKSLNKKSYLETEKKFIDFSRALNINMDELDLLLWSMKNGQIMK